MSKGKPAWILSLSCIPILIGMPAASAEPVLCGLSQCIRHALEHHPAVTTARGEVQAAEAGRERAESSYLPHLNLQLSATEFSGEPTGPFSVSGVTEAEIVRSRVLWGEFGSIGLNLSYPIYKEGSLLGRSAPTVSIADTEIRHQTRAEALTRETVIYEVAAAYFTVAWRRDRLRLAEEWVRWAERQLSVIETESGLGLSTPQEIEVARADLDLRRLALQAAQRAAEQAMRQLSLRIGLTDETDLRFDETLPGLPTLPSLTSLLEKAASEHPEVEIQQTALDRSKLNLTLARAQRRPKVTLESGYTFADDFSAPGNNFFLASLKLEMPLYDFGDYRAAYTEAQTKSRLEEIRLEAVRSDLRATVTEAYGQLLDAEGRVSVAEKELTLADLRHGTVTAQREQGLVGPREPLAAERNRIELRQSLADLRHELRLKYAALQKASGGGFRWVP